MNDYVWFSDVMNDPRRLRPFTNDFYGDEDCHNHEANDWIDRINAGDPLPPECFPKRIWGSTTRGAKQFGKLPDIAFGYGFYFVSERCADVLRQFDLGGGHLYPVEVLQKDKITPIGDHKWFCINFGNVKRAFLAEQSNNIEPFPQNRWAPRAVFTDYDGAVAKTALIGADLWVDPVFWNSIFLSRALGDALKKAKCSSGWGLIKCRVVDKDQSR